MRVRTTDRRGRQLVLPLLAGPLAATAGLFVWAVWERQDLDHAYAMAEVELRFPTRARHRAGEAPARGRIVAAPTTPAEVREMLLFCDTARAVDAPALRETALRAADPLAAANAVRALGRLRAAARDPEVAALLRDPRPRVREETILALGESGDTAAADLLAPLLASDDPKVRLLAIRASRRLGGAGAEAAAREVLERPDATSAERAFARTAASGAR